MKNGNYSDFQSYAKSNGIGSSNMEYHQKQVKSSLTPYILEERDLNVAQIDVFSRLMAERIIWVAGPVDDRMSTIVQAQLMFLDSVDNKDITLHVDTPGGQVKSGLSIVDVMDYVKSDVVTVNTGMAASMGSVLLGAGTKGKRSSLRFSKTMLHQSSGGFSGNIQDARINMKEWTRMNELLFTLLGEYCNKTSEQVAEDAERDLWLSAEEALNYGIIDKIVTKK